VNPIITAVGVVVPFTGIIVSASYWSPGMRLGIIVRSNSVTCDSCLGILYLFSIPLRNEKKVRNIGTLPHCGGAIGGMSSPYLFRPGATFIQIP